MITPTPAEPYRAPRIPPRPHLFEVAFLPGPERVAQMRRLTTAYLRYWQVPEPLQSDMVLVVSELVTNAIQHGKGQVGLRIKSTDTRALIEVSDENPDPPRLRLATDDEVSGRGMLIVDSLAQSWGVSRDGMTTWCNLATGGS
ncbi:ATP-binding protein [Streptomyces sp. NPDC002476]|uniref:ATP-binding protein n=1 Tax=Streptomyces sp. NPDC002476 TaxID=3364648 RepID=UPI0036AF346A